MTEVKHIIYTLSRVHSLLTLYILTMVSLLLSWKQIYGSRSKL